MGDVLDAKAAVEAARTAEEDLVAPTNSLIGVMKTYADNEINPVNLRDVANVILSRLELAVTFDKITETMDGQTWLDVAMFAGWIGET